MAQPEGLEETVVDDTKLKLPDVKLEKVETTTGEEEEEVIYKGYVWFHDLTHLLCRDWCAVAISFLPPPPW